MQSIQEHTNSEKNEKESYLEHLESRGIPNNELKEIEHSGTSDDISKSNKNTKVRKGLPYLKVAQESSGIYLAAET